VLTRGTWGVQRGRELDQEGCGAKIAPEENPAEMWRKGTVNAHNERSLVHEKGMEKPSR